MQKIFISGVLAVALSLSGCTLAIHQARKDMETSKAAYKACLKQHSDDLSKCEASEKAYEADLKAFRAERGLLKGDAITLEK